MLLSRLSPAATRALHTESAHALISRAPTSGLARPVSSGALSQARSLLETSRKQLGEYHPATLEAMARVAVLLAQSSNHEDASEVVVLNHHMHVMWRRLNR